MLSQLVVTMSKKTLITLLATALRLEVTTHLSLVLGRIEFGGRSLIPWSSPWATSISALIIMTLRVLVSLSCNCYSTLVSGYILSSLTVKWLLLVHHWHTVHGWGSWVLSCEGYKRNSDLISKLTELLEVLACRGVKGWHKILHLLKHLLLLNKCGHIGILTCIGYPSTSTQYLLLLCLLLYHIFNFLLWLFRLVKDMCLSVVITTYIHDFSFL